MFYIQQRSEGRGNKSKYMVEHPVFHLQYIYIPSLAPFFRSSGFDPMQHVQINA
jgi:hypothetical protein